MTRLRISHAAERDLVGIWDYTAEKWGEKQAAIYLRKIGACLEKVRAGRIALKSFAEKLRYIRAEHHYIFVLTEPQPTVIAVLHEKMDILARMKDRLG